MGQTVNLDTKYSKDIQKAFTTGSQLQGRLSNDVEFVGARTVRIHTINTVPMGDYNRNASGNRYGIPVEVGDTLQELTMTQDKSFSGVVDTGNNMDQSINKAGKFLGTQMSEVVIPMKDAYGFDVLSHRAGKIVGNTEAISSTNVISRMGTARAHMLNKRVPKKNRTWYVSTAVFNALVDAPQFKNLDALGEKAVIEGQVGMVFGAPVVEVPEDALPDNVNFLLVYKYSAASPSKINDSNMHLNPPGISGNLIEGRFYYDTFVFGAKADGIYVDVTTGAGAGIVLAAPAIAAAGGAITTTGGATAIYTTDGSDPRYSITAKTGTVTGGGMGVTVKAYQTKEGAFDSPVMSVACTS